MVSSVLFCTGANQAGDLARRRSRLLGQLAHLVGNHGKASPLIPGSCGLDGRVQGQQVRLVGDVLDRGNNPADFLRPLPHFPHVRANLGGTQADGLDALHGCLDCLAAGLRRRGRTVHDLGAAIGRRHHHRQAFAQLLERGVGLPCRPSFRLRSRGDLLHLLADGGHGRADFVHAVCLVRRALCQLLHGGRDLLGRAARLLRHVGQQRDACSTPSALPELSGDLAQAGDHSNERVSQLILVAAWRDLHGQIAVGDALEPQPPYRSGTSPCGPTRRPAHPFRSFA